MTPLRTGKARCRTTFLLIRKRRNLDQKRLKRKHSTVFQLSSLIQITADSLIFFVFGLTEQQLLVSLFDLFTAGTETTSTTTLWAFVFMIENPDVMRKVQEEIDSNVGREKMLTNSDRGEWFLTFLRKLAVEILIF
jgi:cytochrome P450